MKPIRHDFSVWRGASGIDGNSNGLVFYWLQSDETPVNLSGYEFILTVNAGTTASSSQLIKKQTPGDISVDIDTAKVTCPLSVADTRLMTSIHHYELESRIGGVERVLLYGYITAKGGANEDA